MKIKNHQLYSRPIVYLDESGFAVDQPRTHGYAPRGQRCLGTLDWHARGRLNAPGAFLAGALLTVGLSKSNVDANICNMWLKDDLLPKLPPASLIIMDNASFHKRNDTKELISNAGHTLEYLPPYSPELNPIEHKWAQAKAIRRKTGKSTEEIFKDKL